MVTIAQKLEQSRLSLLDLSTRNRLLSIPKRASSKLINIYDEKTQYVYEALVKTEKSMTFLPGREIEGEKSNEKTGDDEAGVLLSQPDDDDEQLGGTATRHRDLKLQTKLASDTLQHRLLEMFYDARTFIEEQGVNILYLALGQLKWIDPKGVEKDRLAPLVLVPVMLSRKSAADRFHLSWMQEDAAENLSLAAKLKADFGLLLPEFHSGDDFEPMGYISQVAEVAKAQKGWEVFPDAIALGFFSFAKFLMYRDLDPANWPVDKRIDEQPLIRAVMQDGFASREDLLEEPDRIDAVVTVDAQRHVVDADSSQTLAMEAVRNGAHLVIQGPPGTGKSQTITNVIAAAVADGKKVLFVSEKMAALEVVFRRLNAIGLGEACLELHSNRSNKRRVLEELKATKDLGRPKLELRDEVVSRLDAVRVHLNAHADAMHRRLEPHRLKPYEVLGMLSCLNAHAIGGVSELVPEAATWTPDEFAKRRQLLQELARKADEIGDIAGHSWRGVSHRAVLKLDADRWQEEVAITLELLQATELASACVAQSLGLPEAPTLHELKKQLRVGEKIANAPHLDRGAVAHAVWSAGFGALTQIVDKGLSYALSREKLEKAFLESAWDQDFALARRAIAERGDSLFRIFSGEYRAAVRSLKGQLRTALPKTRNEQLALLDTISESIRLRKEVAAQADFARSAFGAAWQGEGSNWSHLQAVIEWMRGSDGNVVPERFRQLYSRVADPSECGSTTRDCSVKLQSFEVSWSKIAANYALNVPEAFGVPSSEAIALREIASRLERWQSEPVGLFAWTHYFSVREQAKGLGLTGLVTQIEEARLTVAQLVPAFLKASYETVLRDLCRQMPQLVEFDGGQHSRHVEQFRSLDKKRIEIARAEAALRHFEGIPRAATGIGPMGVLNGEIARKRGHMPLRRLFRHAAPAVQAIKPVFMMSPLSVAQFLEPGAIEFDLLVIDEASQIEPVDALGAVARCKQIVVVGDDKQLPPTRFFSRMTSDAERDDEDDEAHIAGTADVESILSLCVSKGMPQKMLRWHYRSRHQSLIAVSNQQFYESRLFVVPSPTTAAGGQGLRFNYVKDGVFDTGGTRVNREEAKAIAHAIMEHAVQSPALSLGVASFSLQQKIAIQDELEVLRRKFPETESFFTAHPNEPFFIKNLENVQGDERDVIFISVAYARNASGYLAMRFGPIGADGGERRLNVLISRAKLRCEVFSSITADDIDLERAKGKGVAALKVFLKYAETGKLSIATSTSKEAGSALETDLKGAVEKTGLTVHQQVGIAGFFIDLAVLDKDNPGRYLLGIELDGDSYHSSRSARDRDRLRQAVLEDHGWILHRVWASDWFRQPQIELDKLLAAVAAARGELAAREELRANAATPVMQFGFLDREDNTSEMQVGFGNRPGETYSEASFDVPKHKELHEVPAYRLAEFVYKIVQEEGPIHTDELVTRLRTLWGLQRAGNRIRDAVEASLGHLIRDKSIEKRESFIDIPTRKVRVRNRAAVSSPALRKPEYLSPVEIQEAIRLLLKQNLGGDRGEIPPAVAKTLGFAVVSSQLRETIEMQIDHLHKANDIELSAGVYKAR
ncbi:DUF3320 domain-containing protein [Ramlibacter sp.]|uniref:DUF3320 domain-containing protein n=1 Tax=Ramlibacter sp. TaxID=1917967 RepID=UPI0025CBF8FA|nr:DUF3320 domain-containing protein [Ramlibacter sp.]